MKITFRKNFEARSRLARCGSLGALAMRCGTSREYQYFLTEVYDLRFPHIGDDRHAMRAKHFDSLGRRAYYPRHCLPGRRWAWLYRDQPAAVTGPKGALP